MIEKWKVIEGYENYMVSDLGNVKNIKRNRILKPDVSKLGYHRVLLNRKHKSIHRLVCIAFKPNPENKETVNHKDNNPSNNRLDNLDWATQYENMQHMIKQGRDKKNKGFTHDRNNGEENGKAKLDWEKVYDIRNSNLSQKELSIKYNMSITSISEVIRYKTWNKKRPTN
jgi:hypothetical protein